MLGESDRAKQEECRTKVKNLTKETQALFLKLIGSAKGTALGPG